MLIANYTNIFGLPGSIRIEPNVGHKSFLLTIEGSTLGEISLSLLDDEANELQLLLSKYLKEVKGAPPPKCIECGSYHSRYGGFEDEECYQCRTCLNFYGYTNPLHT